MTTSELWQIEMERLRTSNLTGLPDSVAFHLGVLSHVVSDLIRRVEELEEVLSAQP